ncbi:hypothetical protein [Flavobacterium cellulosilyticum]|uniref:Right-handed parallel beta-helix repeat-containing protein n=1 Tax=Flavobacterium cellulosilyticum TaxID=2541731 RepID=A0A4R5CCQ8_9FLAO|nr:hypothetical protein [Flavobacterium cellulosilyticum]TDD94944.1 hypothetical protein E0F76_15600 [Flavobacterium cellulosilyticum]
MKNSKLLLTTTAVAVLMMCYSPSQAKIWRVNKGSNYNGTTLFGNNFGGTAAYPVFKELDQVVGSSGWGSFTVGDTIHMEGSTAGIYDIATVVKRCVIIGPGYFLGDNSKTSNDLYEAKIVRINFNTGSAGSVVMGMNVVDNGNTAHGYIQIAADNIMVRRCRIERSVYFFITGGSGLQLATINQNFFPSGFTPNNALYITNTGFVPPVDLIFNNNICQKTLIWHRGNGTIANITQCKNNVFDGPGNSLNLEFTTADFSNNILIPTNSTVNITAAPGQISYNIGTQNTQFGTNNYNLVVPAITTLFTVGTSTDGHYQIQSGTQAYQNGSDGTDRGVFGGVPASRYTLSGLAPVPVVYEATSTGVVSTTTGLPITVKARTIK